MASEATHNPMDLVSNEWCSYAIQVFQPKLEDFAVKSMEKSIVAFNDDKRSPSLRSNHSLVLDEGEGKGMPQWKFDDLKSWIWLQKTIHPELDYDLCMRKKWFSRKITHWNGISIKKWLKEMKQRRKEEERLQNAEVHAAVSVAGVAAALAAVAAQNAAASAAVAGGGHQPDQPGSLRETTVASAAALVAAQCAQVAEAVGAKRDQIDSAISSAMAATDANNILTLTAAAATSIRGAATLRGRPGYRERSIGMSPRGYKGFDFDYGRCKAGLAKGDEILVATPDGRCRLRSVSAVLNRDGKIILKIKKINMLMAFSGAKESIIYDLDLSPLEKPNNEKEEKEEEEIYSIHITTSKGKIELKVENLVLYKKWVTTINHMLTLSKTFTRYELQSCNNY